jgi:hypothetical protein
VRSEDYRGESSRRAAYNPPSRQNSAKINSIAGEFVGTVVGSGAQQNRRIEI